MLDELEVRLSPDGRAGGESPAYTPDMGLLWLNKAQLYVATELDIRFVRELHARAGAQALDAQGAFDLSTLSPAALEGEKGILSVKHTGGKYCRLLPDDERRENEDSSVTYSGSAPVFYLVGNTIHVSPHSGWTVDIEYKKEPVPMALAADNDPANDTNCALGNTFQRMMMEYAAGIGGDTDARLRAEREMLRLNNSYRPYSRRKLEVARLANRRTL